MKEINTYGDGSMLKQNHKLPAVFDTNVYWYLFITFTNDIVTG